MEITVCGECRGQGVERREVTVCGEWRAIRKWGARCQEGGRGEVLGDEGAEGYHRVRGELQGWGIKSRQGKGEGRGEWGDIPGSGEGALVELVK